MIFETARLTVRPLVEEDFDAFHAMQADPVVMQFIEGKGLDRAENQRQLRDCIARYTQRDNRFWVWAIARKSDAAFIGTCALVPDETLPDKEMPNEANTEIGYRLLQRYFGQGYGNEICQGLIAHAIDEGRHTALSAYVDENNLASVKILDNSCLPYVKSLNNETGGRDRLYRLAL